MNDGAKIDRPVQCKGNGCRCRQAPAWRPSSSKLLSHFGPCPRNPRRKPRRISKLPPTLTLKPADESRLPFIMSSIEIPFANFHQSSGLGRGPPMLNDSDGAFSFATKQEHKTKKKKDYFITYFAMNSFHVYVRSSRTSRLGTDRCHQ